MITKYLFSRFASLEMLRSECDRHCLQVGDYIKDSNNDVLYQILEKNHGHNPNWTSLHLKRVLDLPYGKRPDYIY